MYQYHDNMYKSLASAGDSRGKRGTQMRSKLIMLLAVIVAMFGATALLSACGGEQSPSAGDAPVVYTPPEQGTISTADQPAVESDTCEVSPEATPPAGQQKLWTVFDGSTGKWSSPKASSPGVIIVTTTAEGGVYQARLQVQPGYEMLLSAVRAVASPPNPWSCTSSQEVLTSLTLFRDFDYELVVVTRRYSS
jgi:hypothetical protein